MATRHLKTRPEWEDALRSGLKTIDARLVTDYIAGLEWAMSSNIAAPGPGSAGCDSTPALGTC